MAQTTHHQLMGPGQPFRFNNYAPYPPATIDFGFSKKFWFNLGTWTNCLQARWLIEWAGEVTPPTGGLFYWDDGWANVTAFVSGSPTTPLVLQVSAVDITTTFNSLITAKVQKNIGVGISVWNYATVYESHLEITWT